MYLKIGTEKNFINQTVCIEGQGGIGQIKYMLK